MYDHMNWKRENTIIFKDKVKKKNGFSKYVESKETRGYCTSRSPRYNDKKTNAMAAKNVI